VQRPQVINDIRIDDALGVEVCEQYQRAAAGRRLRRKLLLGFANEAECIAAEAVAQGSPVGGAHGFVAKHAPEVRNKPKNVWPLPVRKRGGSPNFPCETEVPRSELPIARGQNFPHLA
jgi:hypothetical protein